MAKAKTSRKTFFRQWRRHRGLTLQAVADRMEMTPSHLSMMERGQRGYNVYTLERLAAALRVDKTRLLMSDPTDGGDFWSIWHRAKPDQRRRIVEAAKAIVKKGD